MTSTPDRRLVLRGGLAGATALAALGLAACTDNPSSSSGSSDGSGGSDGGGQAGTVTVTLTDDACELSATTVPAGAVTFEITNGGTVRNEFEVLAEDQLRIISEQENLGPGTSVTLTMSLGEGTCYAACKPNMVGDLVGVNELTVTSGSGEEVDEDTAELEDEAFTFAADAARQDAADALNETTQQLYDLGYGNIDGAGGTLELTLQDVVNGASSLMNEVATSKIVGEEDTFSHTDLD